MMSGMFLLISNPWATRTGSLASSRVAYSKSIVVRRVFGIWTTNILWITRYFLTKYQLSVLLFLLLSEENKFLTGQWTKIFQLKLVWRSWKNVNKIWLKNKYLVIHEILVVWMLRMSYKVTFVIELTLQRVQIPPLIPLMVSINLRSTWVNLTLASIAICFPLTLAQSSGHSRSSVFLTLITSSSIFFTILSTISSSSLSGIKKLWIQLVLSRQEIKNFTIGHPWSLQ